MNQLNQLSKSIKASRKAITEATLATTTKGISEAVDGFVKEHLPAWDFSSLDTDLSPYDSDWGTDVHVDIFTGQIKVVSTERLADGLFYYISEGDDAAKDACVKMVAFLQGLGFDDAESWADSGCGEDFEMTFRLGRYKV